MKQTLLRFKIPSRLLRAGQFLMFSSALLLCGCRDRSRPHVAAPATLDSASADQFKQAVLRVEQDRGEPTGRQAKVEVPLQLKHYPDSRRFLSLQIAEWRKHHLQTPHDLAELIALIKKGELVEVPALGNAYILYGVGLSATDGPFTHYDKESGDSVPLFGTDAELQQEYTNIGQSLDQLKQANTDLKKQLAAAAPKRDRELVKRLKAEIAENEHSGTSFKQQKSRLNRFYQNPRARQILSNEYSAIAAFAHEAGSDAALTDSNLRKAFKVRLLSYLRPAALGVMESLAKVYQDKFGRPLAITSLVRPDEYQRQLRETNRNATLIDVPPHSTGLAFDVYYRYMTAAEQEFVMAELARLRDEGRIAVLRENLNHYHIFVYIDGHPPEEDLIAKSLDEVGPAPAPEVTDAAAPRVRSRTTSKKSKTIASKTSRRRR